MKRIIYSIPWLVWTLFIMYVVHPMILPRLGLSFLCHFIIVAALLAGGVLLDHHFQIKFGFKRDTRG